VVLEDQLAISALDASTAKKIRTVDCGLVAPNDPIRGNAVVEALPLFKPRQPLAALSEIVNRKGDA
jgi:hypothetical protein